MTTLAIDTATEGACVSLKTDDGRFYERYSFAGLRHTQTLMLTIDSILQESECPAKGIDVVVCAKGPGSFTGLRIGMATAKGLAEATGCSVVSVPTLDVGAYRFAPFPGAVVPVIDARKKRVYCAVYRSNRRETDYLDIDPEDIPSLLRDGEPALLTGFDEGFLQAIAENIPGIGIDPCPFAARGWAFIELGVKAYNSGNVDTVGDGPLYIRKSDAEVQKR